MSTPQTMQAAVIDGDHLTLKEVPVPELRDGFVLVKNRAVAGNPTDWKHITWKIGPQGSIAGCDIAGEIVKLGPNVDTNKFKVGQKVYGFVHGASVKHPDNGGFATYSALDSKIAYTVDDSFEVSGKDQIPEGAIKYYEDVATLPISLTTAGAVLTTNFNINLEWQPSEAQRDFPILFWGGATAVGQLLIQVAKKLHGYKKIIAVASKKHEAHLKSYGADDVFDYHDADVIEQIKNKYPDIQNLVDCVSNNDTIKQVYAVASETKPATIVQLTTLSINDIPESERKDNKTIVGCLLYCASGEEIPFGAFTLPANPEFREKVIKFIEFISPKVIAGDIHHIPVKVYKNGLNDVQQILDDIQHNRNSGEKLVAVLN